MLSQGAEVNVQGSWEQDDLVALDPALSALGRLAVLLGRQGAAGLDEALALLVDGLGLVNAVIRDQSGALRASAGELQVLDSAERPVVGVPLGGTVPATLTVVGAAPGALPLLRVAAAVLGLALSSAPTGDLLLLSEEDRDDLADDLHDGPVQQLVFARYAADAAVRGGDARDARDAVQGALVAMRRTMWHLRPRGADLATALDELSTRLAEAGQRMLAVTVFPGGEALTPAGTALAYRLVQSVALVGSPAEDPLTVTVRPAEDQAPSIVVSLSAPTASTLRLDRWDRRARALGGRLDCSGSADVTHLHLYLPPAPGTPHNPKAAS
jgi:hypothetical protein